jgi:predicted MPP superfamily phosphohydrolase
VVLVPAVVCGLWAFVLEPQSLTTRHHRLVISHWSPEFAGLRVAVLAERHVGSPFNGLGKLQKIVDATNGLTPDLILIPGDLVIHGVPGGTFVTPEDTAAGRFSLLIAGHTHGGQVRVPLLGRPIVPWKYGQRFAHGHVVEGGRHVFVSPVRFGVPPEVTLLELHASNESGQHAERRRAGPAGK